MRRYGMTYEQVVDLLEHQGGCCASCGDEVEIGKSMHVDHCHSSNQVRGILCSACNLMIGHAKDDPERLRLAAKYLENSQKP
jgi:hypothetical protein